MASNPPSRLIVDLIVPSYIGLALFFIVVFDIGEDPELWQLVLVAGGACLSFYMYFKWDQEITKAEYDEKKLEKVKMEAKMAELEKFEMQNTCKRCGKIWFLGANELADIEAQLRDHEGTGKTLGLLTGLNLFTSLTSPGTGNFAQHSTTTAIGVSTNVAKVDRIKDEFDEKARCPDCKSTDSERELVEKGKGVKKSAVPKNNSIISAKKSKKEAMRELKEMFEEGLIEEDEFKEQKNKILNS